jgi:hypothetical protein
LSIFGHHMNGLNRLFVVIAVCWAASASVFPAHSSGPMQLSCNGKMTAASRRVTEDYTIAITVELGAGTVKVGSYGTVPIVGNADGDTLVFMKNKDSLDEVSTGTLNRITGVTSVHIITLVDGLYLFYGTCKPAQRLF